jgi:trk system potassium uptake protein TrkH
MNYGMIRFVLSWILRLEGLLMFLPCVIALVCREEEGWVYLILAGIAVAAGVLLSKRPKNMEIYQKEGGVF